MVAARGRLFCILTEYLKGRKPIPRKLFLSCRDGHRSRSAGRDITVVRLLHQESAQKKKAPSFADSHAHHEAARRGVEGTAGIYDSIRLNAATAEGAHRPMRSGRPQSNAHPLHG